MEKVKLPREVAEAIEELRSNGVSNFGILHRAYNAVESEPDLAITRWAFDSGEGTPDLLMHALVNGYEIEIEKTPEERLREYYEYLLLCQKKHAHKGEYTKADARLDGFLTALELLEVKIEGVNA